MAKYFLVFSSFLLFFQAAYSQETASKWTNEQDALVLSKEDTKSLQEIEKMLFTRMEEEKAKMATTKHLEEIAKKTQTTGNNDGSVQLMAQSSGLPTQAEYDALMDFYAATNGASWINKTGWSTANPNVIQDVSGFAGVSTNANGNVFGIYLPVNNIHGQIPESFGDLIYLEQVYLFSNKLYQNIPQSIGNLINLKGLYLNSSQLDWNTIPSSVGNLINLEYLHLHSNYLVGEIPASFSQLTKLKELYLLYTKLNGEIPAFVGNMTDLVALRLENSEFSGPIPTTFSNLTDMVDFRLHNNKLTGPVPGFLCTFPNLTTVTLQQNNLTGTLPACLYSKNLAYLWVANNNFSVESLVEMSTYFTNTSDYLPQRQSMDTVSIQVYENSSLKLTTDLGRNTPQPSKYRWVKDGVPLFNDFREEAFSYLDESFVCSYNDVGPNICDGIYYVEISNPAFPQGTIIKGNLIAMETIPSLKITICAVYQPDQEFNFLLLENTFKDDCL